MSEVKVDTISERTAAGGVTIDGVLVKDGVATFQTAAGSPLVFEGATADAFETTFAITDPTADRTITFPDSSFTVPTSGGLTQLSQWRLTADFTNVAAPITSNLAEVATPDGFGKLPDVAAGLAGSMAVDVNGAFTFPSTGLWRIDFISFLTPFNVQTSTGSIYTTHNDSTWVQAAFSSNISYYGLQSASCSYLFRVAGTSTHKVRFHIGLSASAASCTTHGDADVNETSMTFLKLADT